MSLFITILLGVGGTKPLLAYEQGKSISSEWLSPSEGIVSKGCWVVSEAKSQQSHNTVVLKSLKIIFKKSLNIHPC